MIGWSAGGVVLPPYVALLVFSPRHDLYVLVNYFGFVLVALFLVGLLGFEALVYLGLRRLKYANVPGSEAELAPPEIEPPEAELPEVAPGGGQGGGPVPDGGI